LDVAASRPRRAKFAPPKSRRATELKLVNSIMEEWRLPTVVERVIQGVDQPMTSHLDDEFASALPSNVGPGALVEIRL
jgi:hypothetical protein